MPDVLVSCTSFLSVCHPC